MSDSIKGKVEQAGHKLAETATKVGHKISEGVEQATDWAKEKLHQAGNRAEEAKQKAEHAAEESCCSGSSCSTGTASIQEHMAVIGSCGTKLGVVDHVEGNSIKLTKSSSPDGQHHLIPLSWVDHVDTHVHLNKDCGAAQRDWQSA